MLEKSIVLNANSKVPLYVQLKEQIKEYISAGNAGSEEQLPPVTSFADKLGINFETVRKAYKELESEGLIVMKRGLGTFFKAKAVNQVTGSPKPRNGNFVSDAKELIKHYLKKDLLLGDIKEEFDRAIGEVFEEYGGQKVIFTECSNYQVEIISQILTQALTSLTEPGAGRFYINVQGVLLDDLKDYLDQGDGKDALTVVTTGFHYDEVKEIVGGRPFNIHVLITNMSKEARQKLATFGEETKYGFISSFQHSASLFADIFKEELGDVEIKHCTVDDQKGVKKLIETSDVILVPPSVYEKVQKLVPPDCPLVVVSDRVDSMSIKLLKDRLISANGNY